MQKGVFTTWIKELCALVFVQTIQAFILAIVLSIILTFIKNTGSSISDQATVSSLGVLCIVLLTSLTKMEQITKKIFGLDSGILQQKPPHGLAATMLALKSVGRIFNNVPKIASGIGAATFGANSDKKKAQNRALGKLQRRGFDKNGSPLLGGASGNQSQNGGSAGEGFAGAINTAASLGAEKENNYRAALKAKREGDMDKYRELMKNSANASKKIKQIANDPLPPIGNLGASVGNNPNIGNSAAAAIKTVSDKDKDNYMKIMDQLDDDLSKAKEKRRKGIETAVSGLMETAGASVGAMTGLSIGAVSGLATNDLDQIPKSVAYGIGVGDMAGESLTKAVSSVSRGIKDRASVNKSLNAKISEMEKNLKINSEARGRQATRVKNIMKEVNNRYNNNSLP